MSAHSLYGKLKLNASHRSVSKDEVIFRAGSPARAVWQLIDGGVSLLRYGKDGEVVPIHQALPGEFFAEASLHSDRYHCTAVAQRASQLIELPSDMLKKLLESDSDFNREWLAILSNQLRQARLRVERLCLRGAPERVRHLLLTEGVGPRRRYAVAGSLKDLAAALGITHESLYRTLAEMERRGSIVRTPGEIRLP